jgi:hypothetical protein
LLEDLGFTIAGLCARVSEASLLAQKEDFALRQTAAVGLDANRAGVAGRGTSSRRGTFSGCRPFFFTRNRWLCGTEKPSGLLVFALSFQARQGSEIWHFPRRTRMQKRSASRRKITKCLSKARSQIGALAA